MKNSKMIKITSLIISCLLLIGAAVGISVSANDAPTVEIKFVNLAYESAPQLVYYVDAANVAEDQTVKVLVYDSKPEAVTLEGATVVDAVGTLNAGDTSYAAFLSEEIAPKDLRLKVWAAPAVLAADGSIAASGEAVGYSVFDYALARFGMNPTEDQNELYTSLLSFGAAVQQVLYEQGTYTEDDLALAGGFADEYCGFSTDVYVDGKLAEKGEVAFYRPGSAIELSEDMMLGESVFQCFADEDGKEIEGTHAYPSTSLVISKPGYTTYNSVYATTGGKFIDFETGDLAANNISPATTAALEEKIETTSYSCSAEVDGETVTKTYTVSYIKAGKSTLVDGTYLHSRHARVVGLKDADGNEVEKTADEKVYVGLNFTANATGVIGSLNAGSSFVALNSVPNMSTYKKVLRHVYQFDVLVGNANGQSQGWFVNSDNHKLWGYTLTVSGNTIKFTVQGDSNSTNCPDHGKTIASGLDKSVWHTVRFEYYDLPDDKMEVFAYVDGVFCPNAGTENGAFTHKWNEVKADYVTKNKNDAYVKGFNVNYLYGATQIDTYYDNIYTATEYAPSGAGSGIYINDPSTVDFDYTEELEAVGKTMADVYTHDKTAAFLGVGVITSAFGKTADDATSYQKFVNEDGNWYLTSGVNNAYAAINVAKTLPESTSADKYIVELDLRYHGFGENDVPKSSSGGNFGWIRFYDDAVLAEGDKWDQNITLSLAINDKGASDKYFTLDGVSLPKGEWLTIRIEASSTEGNNKKMDYKLFVNDMLVKSNTYTVAGSAPNAYTDSFGRVYFQARTFDNYYAYDLDNFYMGVVNNDQ